MKRILLPMMAAGLFASPAAIAAVSEAEIEQMRVQLEAMSQRLEALAAENAELKRAQERTNTAVADVQTSMADIPAARESWSDRIRLDGDFRYRLENIDAEGSASRDRQRIRARANVKAGLTDDVEVGFGLATGGDDPVSTNQTIGGGGSSKSVVLNVAYVDWEAVDGLHLFGGKFKNPLMRAGKNSLMWDGDWTPEGVALSYERDWFFANAIGTYLESDTRKSNDNFSWGAQIGASGEIGGAMVKGGIAYYSMDTQGDATAYGDPTDPGDYFGNTAVEASGLPCGSTGAECQYLYDYDLTEIFAEAAFEVGGLSALVFFDWVKNSDPSDNDTGWIAGTKIGQTKDRGDVQFTYYYADKEADSMIGLLTDSDFGGGGTDSKGHWLQLNYGVNKTWTIGAQYFINEIDQASGSERDYDRLMIDTQWKWK